MYPLNFLTFTVCTFLFFGKIGKAMILTKNNNFGYELWYTVKPLSRNSISALCWSAVLEFPVHRSYLNNQRAAQQNKQVLIAVY